MTLLFVYGTLKEKKVQQEVLGRIAESFSDTLSGYTLVTIKIKDKTYPQAVPQKNSKIKGLVLSIAPEELKKLDQYETKAYQRKKVILESGKEAWVYQN